MMILFFFRGAGQQLKKGSSFASDHGSLRSARSFEPKSAGAKNPVMPSGSRPSAASATLPRPPLAK
jgi:hypothetical protein